MSIDTSQQSELHLYLTMGLSLCLFSQTKDIHTASERYDPDRLKSKAQYYYDYWSETNVLHGRKTSWNKEGKIIYDAFFQDGLQTGEAVQYFSNGRAKIIEQWAEDQPHGVWKYYRKDGSLAQTMHFKMGIKTGSTKFYNRKGALTKEVIFEKGKKTKRRTYFDKEGNEVPIWYKRIDIHPFSQDSTQSEQPEAEKLTDKEKKNQEKAAQKAQQKEKRPNQVHSTESQEKVNIPEKKKKERKEKASKKEKKP